MKRISSTSIVASQRVQKSVRRQWNRLPKWMIAVTGMILLSLSIVTGLICVLLPMMAFAAILFFTFEIRFTNPVSDVWDLGDALELERLGERERIAIQQIQSISLSTWNNPPYSVIDLNPPSRWGTKLTWFPDPSGSGDTARSIIADLESRIAAGTHSVG